MKSKVVTLAVLAAFVLLAGPALAGAKDKVVTLEGEIVCAKCTLKTEGLKECQNVLRVAKKEGEPAYYWIAKNQVSESVGHVCGGVEPMKITGTLAEKDGHTWIMPKEMKAVETS